MLVGMGQEVMTLPMAQASIREIDIYGSFRYCNTVRHRFCIVAARYESSLYHSVITSCARQLHLHWLHLLWSWSTYVIFLRV